VPLYNPLDGKQIKRTRSFDAFAKKKEDAEKFTDVYVYFDFHSFMFVCLVHVLL